MTERTKKRRTGSHRARKGEGALLREEILDAAEDLLYRHGNIDAVSIRAIAHRVGVTPPAIYLHFEDKDRLFYAVCRRGFDRFAARLAPVMAGDTPAIERVRRLGEEYVRFGLENWQQYPVLFGVKTKVNVLPEELADDPGLRILEGLVALVEQAMVDGDIRGDLSPDTVAGVMWATAHGIVELLLGAKVNPDLVPVPSPEVLVPATLNTILAGFRP
ncbi:MAG: TetR/AcrR family transcriptional regulator [Actinomycetota bacterium]